MDILGGPDEPLSADKNALALIKERYPYLGDGHIVDALNHVHVQLYGQPLCQASL